MSEVKPREFYIGSHLIIVDEEMLPILSKYTWCVKPSRNTFYAFTNVKIGELKTVILMHRLITGMGSGEIDHINRNGLDNRLCNLRTATKKQNSYNRVRKNKFGYRGVYQAKDTPRFSFQIQIDGKKVRKHGFETPEQAARAYDEMSKELHGEFGIRNFKD